MKQTTPLVSILLPIQNGEEFLVGSIKSLLSQSYKNIEIIAIDDNSTDNSFTLLKSLAKKDKRLKCFRNVKRYGLAICFNRAFAKAKGNFIAFMHPRDVSLPHRIKNQLSFLRDYPKIVAVGSQFTIIDEHNKHLEQSDLPTQHQALYQKLLNGNSMLFESCMIDRHMLPKDVLYFSPQSRLFLYTEIFVKLSQYGELANIKEVLYLRRVSENLEAKTFKLMPKYMKLLLTSIANHDYRPSLRSLFTGMRISVDHT